MDFWHYLKRLFLEVFLFISSQKQLYILIGLCLVVWCFQKLSHFWRKSTIFCRGVKNLKKSRISRFHFKFFQEIIICTDCEKSLCTWGLRNPSLLAPFKTAKRNPSCVFCIYHFYLPFWNFQHLDSDPYRITMLLNLKAIVNKKGGGGGFSSIS